MLRIFTTSGNNMGKVYIGRKDMLLRIIIELKNNFFINIKKVKFLFNSRVN